MEKRREDLQQQLKTQKIRIQITNHLFKTVYLFWMRNQISSWGKSIKKETIPYALKRIIHNIVKVIAEQKNL